MKNNQNFKQRIINLGKERRKYNYAIVNSETKEIIEKFRLKQTAFSVLPKMQKMYFQDLKIVELEDGEE